METSVHEYIEVLHNELDSRFPNTIRFQIAGGDYIMDCVMELREGDSRLQYSPYDMFLRSAENYEDSILEFCNRWEMIRRK